MITTVDECLEKVRSVFAKLIEAPDECLSRADLIEIVGEAHYLSVRGALLATDKVESAMGRAGGLAIKRAQGNRREWGQSAETRARRHLTDLAEPLAEEGPIAALREVNEEWPQSRIADALGVSQATISNWLRTGAVNPKYSDGLHKLRSELKAAGPASDGNVRAAEPRSEETPYGDWLRAELARQDTNAVDLAARTGIHINTILALLDGRTERPQQRTRQRIEKALQPALAGGAAPTAPSRSPEEDTWYYIGLPWTSEEIDQVPDEPGVYIIHDRLGRPAYVGVAHKGAGGIRARLRKHNELRWTSDPRVASRFSYALSGRMPSNDPSLLAKALEKLLIKFMGNAILINEKDVEDIAE